MVKDKINASIYELSLRNSGDAFGSIKVSTESNFEIF